MRSKFRTAAIIIFTLLAGLLVAGIAYLGFDLYLQNQITAPIQGADASSIEEISFSDTKVAEEAEKEQNKDGKKTEKAGDFAVICLFLFQKEMDP